MRGGTYIRGVALASLQILISSFHVCGHAAQIEGCPAAGWGNSRDLAIVIDSVELPEDAALTPESRAHLLAELKSKSFHASSSADSNWQNEIGQEVRMQLQDRGYFKVMVDVASGLIRAEPSRLHYWVTVQVESGPQYRLGDVRFENASVFTDRVLRPEVPLREGDVFSASAIREGLMRITRLYGKRGYVDTAIEPRFSIDSDVHRIDIVFRLDPGIQYRIGSVRVRGWSASAESLVRSKFEFGQVFDATALREFFEENKKLLPSGVTAENSVSIARDPPTGTVGIVFEYRRCQTS